MADLNEIKKKAKTLLEKGEKASQQEKVNLLNEVGKLRGELLRAQRQVEGAMRDEIRTLLKKIGKTFPPYLYKLRKK